MNTICKLVCQRNKFMVQSFLPTSRNFKSDLKIKWVRPQKISCIDPRKSGDREPAMYPSEKELPVEFKNSDAVSKYDKYMN